MVEGLDLFIDHFKEYPGHYMLIGGGACDYNFEQKEVSFRVTKDLDLLLIVEALSDEFVKHFWQFIKDGDYQVAEVNEKKVFYRFYKPAVKGFPKMIELFSRSVNLTNPDQEIHVTDIPTGEDVSSLSAILLVDEYYHFALTNSLEKDGLHVANEIALIALKARAFLNNLERKEQGQKVHEDDIIKHKKDIIRLTVTLNPALKAECPTIVHNDLKEYIAIVKAEGYDPKPLLKSMGLGELTLDQIFDQLTSTFGLDLHG